MSLKKMNDWLEWRGISWMDLLRIALAMGALGFIIVISLSSIFL